MLNSINEYRCAKAQQQQKKGRTTPKKRVPINTLPATIDENEKPLGMAWYKFLIYFSLIASAILNIVDSFNFISGGIYFVKTNGEVSAEQVYSYYGAALQIVDVFFGIFLIAFAMLALVVRHKLANYKPDSLKFVKIFYSISVGAPFLYNVLVVAITRQPHNTIQTITSAIIGLVFLHLNIIYFNKRAHLFVDKTISTQPHSQSQTKSQSIQKNNEIPIVSKPTISEKPTIMFCGKCGTKLYENSAFCHKCGSKTIPDSL